MTASYTPTLTPTPTITNTPGATWTPETDIFTVTKNLFQGGEPVFITVGTSQYPGNLELSVYNSAGEHIKTLVDRYLTAPYTGTVYWDGTNKFGDKVASGVYIFYLVEPFDRKVKRIIFIK